MYFMYFCNLLLSIVQNFTRVSKTVAWERSASNDIKNEIASHDMVRKKFCEKDDKFYFHFFITLERNSLF